MLCDLKQQSLPEQRRQREDPANGQTQALHSTHL